MRRNTAAAYHASHLLHLIAELREKYEDFEIELATALENGTDRLEPSLIEADQKMKELYDTSERIKETLLNVIKSDLSLVDKESKRRLDLIWSKTAAT